MDLFTCPKNTLETVEPLVLQDSTPVHVPVSFQKPASLLSEYESLLTTSLSGALQTLELILEEHAENVGLISSARSSSTNYENMTEEEYLALVSHNSEVTNRTAAIILQIIGLTGTELAGKPLCWNRVSDEVKAFLVHRFARESVLSFVAKLKRELNCISPAGKEAAGCKCREATGVNLSGGDHGVECKKEQCHPPPEVKRSVQKLFYATECLVDNMVTLQEEQETGSADQKCLYDRIAGDISAGRHNANVKWLADFIFYHLKPVEEHAAHIRDEISTEVEAFVTLMLNWLDQQTHQQARKGDLASAALAEIKRVEADLLGLKESSWTRESHPSKPSTEEEPQPTSDEPLTAGDLSVSETYESAVCDKDTDEATVLIDRELEELCCALVQALVDKILEDLVVIVSSDTVNNIKLMLKEMLFAEVADSDIDVKTSGQRVKSIVKATYKDLFSKKQEPKFFPLALLSEDPFIYKNVIETLKRRLLSAQKRSGVVRLLRCVCKPVTTCFQCKD